MRFFRDPQDLLSWVQTHGSKKAASILVNLPKVGNKYLTDVVETTKRMADNNDHNAAHVLYAILQQSNIVEADLHTVENNIEQVNAANELLTHKIIAKDEHAQLVKQAQIMRQPGQYDMPLRICPKLPWSVGKKLISTYNCRHYCLDGVVLDDDPTRVYCGELLWRRHVADKFSSDFQDRKTGKLIGGYINDRFFKFPDAGTPGNPDVARDGGNPMMLKPGERTRTPRPHQWSIERRMQEMREKNSTQDHTLGKTASNQQSVKTAGGWDSFSADLVDVLQPIAQRNSKVSDEEFVRLVNLDPTANAIMSEEGMSEDDLLKFRHDRFYQFLNDGSKTSVMAGWVGRMVAAQSEKTDSDIYISDDSHSPKFVSGYITKTLPGGVEVELDWTSDENKVSFEWPQDLKMGTNEPLGDWSGDVRHPNTHELLLSGLDRENLEDEWAQEILETIYRSSRRASSIHKVVEADGKDKKVNPWAVCHTTVDKNKNPEKYEQCVLDIKEDQKDNVEAADARKVIMAAGRNNFVKISSNLIDAAIDEDNVFQAFSMSIDLKNNGMDNDDAVIEISEKIGMPIAKAVAIQNLALKKMASHISDVYEMDSARKNKIISEKSDEEVQEDASELGLIDDVK